MKSVNKKKFLIINGNRKKYMQRKVEIFFAFSNAKKILIDITRVKNNKKSFMILKKKNLRWSEMITHNNPDLNIEPFFTIPYNSFHKYYYRSKFSVGDKLWKKVSNNNFSILDLIKIIDNLGEIIRKELLPLCMKFKFYL